MIIACGGCVSIVQAYLARTPVFCAASSARTSNVCGPSGSGGVEVGEKQGADAAPSTEHVKVADASGEVKRNAPAGVFVGDAGLDVMATVGAVASMVHVYVAGVASEFPAASTA